MLATSMSGRASKALLSLAPPLTSIGAQFMYSSGAPDIFENQVQAKVALPLGMLSGSSKLYSFTVPSTPGQPPSMDLMTLKTEFSVGSVSIVTDSWQEPPPWTAVPLNLIVCCSPTAMVFILDTLNPRFDLHGNCDLVMGPLSILSTLYGTGDSMMIWALTEAKNAAAATMVDRIDMMVVMSFRSCNDSVFKECDKN
jgi:hypothetical protein